jgi:preprotein translocase subunit Sss1
MTPGEELMLLLELNGYDVTRFKLKKQLEYEQSGDTELHKHKTLADLIVAHYQSATTIEPHHRNPLSYRKEWGPDVTDLRNFFVAHPDLLDGVTLEDVIRSDEFDEVHKESILYDVLDHWVEEYRESSITRMENLREMIRLMPKKNRKYKKPSRLAMIGTLLLALFGMLIYLSPDTLTDGPVPFMANIVTGMVELLHESTWYALLGNVAIYALLLYVIANMFFRRYMVDIRSDKNKRSEQTFDKWEQQMKTKRLEQAGVLEDYVDRVIRHPKQSSLSLTELEGPERFMQKLKDYVMMVERRYDVMTRYYRTYRRVLRLWLLFAWFSMFAFIGIWFAVEGGWIDV